MALEACILSVSQPLFDKTATSHFVLFFVSSSSSASWNVLKALAKNRNGVVMKINRL